MNLLRLLQLADSALPVGGLAHSFGLETMIEQGEISKAQLFSYFKDLLCEGLLLEAVFCRIAHSRGRARAAVGDLNEQLSALRLARESRNASITLGNRFAALLQDLEPDASLGRLLGCDNNHFAVAFGYGGGILGFDAGDTTAALLHQSIAVSISVCQRLLSVGQLDAARMGWDLKPYILETAARSAASSVAEAGSFAHLPELASMRHPSLATRLFVS